MTKANHQRKKMKANKCDQFNVINISRTIWMQAHIGKGDKNKCVIN